MENPFNKPISNEEGESLKDGLMGHVTSVESLIPGTKIDDLPALDTKSKPKYENREGCSSNHTPYSDLALELFKELDKEKVEEIKESFKDTVIIDIGAGRYKIGYNLACALGAKGYIAVEPFNFHDLARDFSRQDANPEDNPIPFNIVAEDGLSFLERLPTESVLTFTFGLGDGAVIGEKSYLDKLENEIRRVHKVVEYFMFSSNSLYAGPRGMVASELIADEFAQIRKMVFKKPENDMHDIKIIRV